MGVRLWILIFLSLCADSFYALPATPELFVFSGKIPFEYTLKASALFVTTNSALPGCGDSDLWLIPRRSAKYRGISFPATHTEDGSYELKVDFGDYRGGWCGWIDAVPGLILSINEVILELTNQANTNRGDDPDICDIRAIACSPSACSFGEQTGKMLHFRFQDYLSDKKKLSYLIDIIKG